MYESASLFFGDIVGFTQLTALSTASQTIKELQFYSTKLYSNLNAWIPFAIFVSQKFLLFKLFQPLSLLEC